MKSPTSQSHKRKRACSSRIARDTNSRKTAKEPRRVTQQNKRRRNREPSLCDVCWEVDFVAIFDGTRKDRQALPTLRQARSNAQCKFCQFLAETTRDLLQLPQYQTYLDARCVLKYGVCNDLYLQAHSTSLLRQACVWVHEKNDPPNSTNRSRSRSGKGVLLAALDSTAFFPVKGSPLQPYAMVRRPVPERFDTGKLREWLDMSSRRAYTSRKLGTVKRRGSLTSLQQTRRFRLLDVHSGHLITAKGGEPYVALSYVWGSEMAQYLKTRNIGPSLESSIDILPWTIRDAASLVAEINERYLWIDALCIDQGDVGDQRANIEQMGAIYQNALFTIVAADGAGANAGLSRLRPSSNKPECPLSLDGKKGGVSILKDRHPMEAILQLTMWSTRGWTMQERVLSDTCVFFTHDEVLFQSRNFEAREAYELTSLESQIDMTGQGKSSTRRRQIRDQDVLLKDQAVSLTVYNKTISEFTARNFSHDGDKLDAFTGIARYLHTRRSSLDTILGLAGLPATPFVCALFWECTSNSTPTRIPIDTSRTRFLPSWSWVGWNGQCHIPGQVVNTGGNQFARRVEVLGAANVVCDTRSIVHRSPTPDIERVPVLRPLRTTLHLWAGVRSCEVLSQSGEHAETGYDIMVAQDDPSLTPVQMTVGSNQMSVPTIGAEHRIVSYKADHLVDWLLLVERCGEFFERLGILHVGWLPTPESSAIAKLATFQWIRLQ